MDLSKGGQNWDHFLRVQVLIDLEKPLLRVLEVDGRNGKDFKVNFIYENISMFCYACGLIGHGTNDCENGPFDGSMLYGHWMRVMTGGHPPSVQVKSAPQQLTNNGVRKLSSRPK